MNLGVLPRTSSAVSVPAAGSIHTSPLLPPEPAQDWRIASRPRPAGVKVCTLQKPLLYVIAGMILPLASTAISEDVPRDCESEYVVARSSMAVAMVSDAVTTSCCGRALHT
jgi:hypothetical protein